MARPNWDVDDLPSEPEPNRWHLHGAGAKGVTFHCDYIGDVDTALETFKRDAQPVMAAWPNTVIQMSVTIC